ncbi:uncharacterized protein LOC131929393 [Physella acuta]|uniref:uncharacterized protein LOC131929393 n=1 Tax=Physella acuta TaxID=109671 RepID=UPI0027DE6CC6|nr:uncharacterized protein LOC131929393 [Physella acuta]XP_059141542.1 uncharacterized protein LOC131929393 [Physella acuta]
MAITFKQLQKQASKLHHDLQRFSGLSDAVVENVLAYAKCLARPGSGDEIDDLIFIAQMSKQFNITSPTLLPLMFEAIKYPKATYATVEQFCKLICTFLCDDIEKKMDFVFSVYDINRDGTLSFSELYFFIKPCTIATDLDEDHEESTRELIELVLKISDIDENGQIEKGEFKELVRANSLYLQLLGPCLPNDKYLERFREKIDQRSGIETKRIFHNERRSSLYELQSSRAVSLYPVILDMPSSSGYP